MQNIRAEQLAGEIQRELSDLIRTKVRDPRVGLVTITHVKVSGDLSFARVLYSVMPGEDEDQSREGINKAAGFLRRELGKRLRLRNVPELNFQQTDSVEYGIHMTGLLDDLGEESGDPGTDPTDQRLDDEDDEEDDA